MRPSLRRTKQAVRALAAVLLVFLTVCPRPAAAVERAGTGKVVIFVVDQVNLNEIDKAGTPNIEKLIKSGGIGLMSVRNQPPGDAIAQYLSIGAGNKAVGIPVTVEQTTGAPILEGFGFGEAVDGRSASNIYTERTGKAFRKPQAVNLSISALIEFNKLEQTDAVPGALGDALAAAGLKTAAVGNADSAGEYHRSVIDIVMNGNGRVDYGRLDRELTKRDSSFPTGRRTDPDKLYAAFAAAYGTADVIAVDWGDTTRVRAEAAFLTAGRQSVYVEKSLKRADDFLGKIIEVMDPQRDLLILVTPTPSAIDVEDNRIITPVIISGPGIGRGFLTSASTRRDAVIVNTDLAPTVLKHFGLETPVAITGRPVTSVASGSDDPLRAAIDLSDRWVEVRNLMNVVLRGIAYWDIGLLVLFMGMLMPKRLRPAARKVRWLLLTVPAIPLAVLLLPILHYGPVFLVALELIALTALIVFAVYRFSRSPVQSVGLISLSVAAALLIDLGTGTNLIQDSLLGYSVVNGARFYGLGNEYFGVLAGAIIIGSFYIMSLREGRAALAQKVSVVILMLISLFMIGAPQLGADFGGLLAALIGFGLMSLGYIRNGYKPRDIVVIGIAAAAAVAAFVFYDVSRGASGESHVGQLAVQIGEGGLAPLVTIVERKLAMNARLVQFAFWSWVNAASVAALGLAFYGLRNLIKLVNRKYPYFKPTMVGGLSVCLGALVFNDSGVVAMAMIFLFLVPATLYLITYEVEE